VKILLENLHTWTREHYDSSGFFARKETILDGRENTEGNTPLHIAAYNGYTDIARLLVQAGASATVENRDNKTPIDLASEQGHGSLAEMLDRIPELHDAIRSGSHPPDMETIRRLIDEEQSINVKHPATFHSHDGYTPLHGASRQGHAEVVQALLDAGADIYLTDKSEATALDIALGEGHAEIAEILRNAGTPINLPESSLESAVSNGYTETVRIITEYLIENGRRRKYPSIYGRINFNININSDDRRPRHNVDDVTSGYSLLHVAAANGYTEIARLLVQAGAYVMAKNNDHKTPIDLAHEHGHEDLAQMLESALALSEAAVAGDAETVRRLLAAGAHTDVRDGRGATALYSVVETYLEEVARLLIQAGADVNAPKQWTAGPGDTPLLMVAGMGERATMSVNIAEALVNAGANVGVSSRPTTSFALGSYGTPLHRAASANHVEMVKLLLRHGANVDAEDNSENSPLHRAIYSGHGEVARLLIEAGADAQARNHAGNTPVQMAAFAGLPEVIKLLVEAGSPVNLQDQVEDTPLHDAALKGQVEAARALLAAGADVHARNNVGHTPLGLARLQGHENVAAVLKAAKAGVGAR